MTVLDRFTIHQPQSVAEASADAGALRPGCGGLCGRDRAAHRDEGAPRPLSASDRHQADSRVERDRLRRRAARAVHRRRGHASRPRALAAGARAVPGAGGAGSGRRQHPGAQCRHDRRQPLLRRAAQRPGDAADRARRPVDPGLRLRHPPAADGLVHHGSDGDRPPPRRDSGRPSRCRSRRRTPASPTNASSSTSDRPPRSPPSSRSTTARSPTPGSWLAASASARNGSWKPKRILRGQPAAAASATDRGRRHPG